MNPGLCILSPMLAWKLHFNEKQKKCAKFQKLCQTKDINYNLVFHKVEKRSSKYRILELVEK